MYLKIVDIDDHRDNWHSGVGICTACEKWCKLIVHRNSFDSLECPYCKKLSLFFMPLSENWQTKKDAVSRIAYDEDDVVSEAQR